VVAASGSGVRAASAQDAAACDIPTVADMTARSHGLRATHEWLVLERADEIVGFAHGQPLNRLAALSCTAEAGASVDVQPQCAGGGRELCTQLLRRLAERGFPARFADCGRAPWAVKKPSRRYVS
jgi:L-amino acid N-acyltransferase YncA